MALNTRKEFVDYCLRKLGYPVINIEVAEAQVSDRVDDALQLFEERHMDATEEKWVYYELTADDIADGYITTPDEVLQVLELMPVNSMYGFGEFFASEVGQAFGFDSLVSWGRFDAVTYYMTSLNYTTMLQLTSVTPRFEFIKHRHELRIDRNLSVLAVDHKVAVKIIERIDSDANGDLWNDKWLKEYATALIKRQWGSNTKKMGQITMLGGVTMNGQEIYDEAETEIEKLIETLADVYEEPIGFILG